MLLEFWSPWCHPSDITVNEILATVNHFLFPSFPSENVESVLAVLRNFDVDQKVVVPDSVSGISFTDGDSLKIKEVFLCSNMFVLLFICLPVCLSVCLCVCPSMVIVADSISGISFTDGNTLKIKEVSYVVICVLLFICLFVCMSVCLSVCLCVCPSMIIVPDSVSGISFTDGDSLKIKVKY